jgi:DNA-binding HxlR family transcriptional regulator
VAEIVDLETQNRAGSLARERSVGEVLRLVGSESAGSILAILGQRPLRTKQLTERVRDYSARSVYRCVGRLEEFGLVEHWPDPDAPSQVLLRLTKPAGRNLFRLLRRFTSESTAGLASRESGLSWEALCQLGELWEFATELGLGSRSLVNLLDGTEGMTYHQVRRRACQLVEAGLLDTTAHNGSGNGRHYELTDRSRRRMVMIASLGRWRHRYLLADGTPGLEVEEMATVLRTTMPLVTLPEHSGKSIDFVLTGADDKYGDRDTAGVRGAFEQDGTLKVSGKVDEEADGSATATLNTWFAALLDDNRGRIRVRGDLTLVDACLTRLYNELWIPLKR